jgi:hypothetical protein
MTPIRPCEFTLVQGCADTRFHDFQLGIGCIELHHQELEFFRLRVNRGVVGPATRTRMIPMTAEFHGHGTARGALIAPLGQTNLVFDSVWVSMLRGSSRGALAAGRSSLARGPVQQSSHWPGPLGAFEPA